MPAAFFRPEPGKGFVALSEITADRFDFLRRRLSRRELGKDVISANSQWAWILFVVQDRKRASNAWEAPAYLLTGWRRKDRIWTRYAHFKLPSKLLGKALATLSYWNAALPDLIEKADAADSRRKKSDPISELLGVNTDALWREFQR